MKPGGLRRRKSAISHDSAGRICKNNNSISLFTLCGCGRFFCILFSYTMGYISVNLLFLALLFKKRKKKQTTKKLNKKKN